VAADKEKEKAEAALDPKSIWKLREAKAKEAPPPAGLRGYMNRMWSSKKSTDGGDLASSSSSKGGESSPPTDTTSSSSSVPVK
jgi:hypothetical protein